MAHYAQDCWDAEILGSYGWVECVGIAHRGCYDLTAHENATGQKLRAWTFEEPKLIEVDGWTIDGAKARPAFRALAGKVKEYVEDLEADVSFPHRNIISMVKKLKYFHYMSNVFKRTTVTGEWYVPHVVEPAFGIDRIIWHVLDHSYKETKKEGEDYTLLSIPNNVAPIDVAVLPLSEKDGMQNLGRAFIEIFVARKAYFRSMTQVDQSAEGMQGLMKSVFHSVSQ